MNWQNDLDRRSESFQFELYVGSLFWMAGVAREFREPDLVVTLLGEQVGVAAKYVFSDKKARKASIKAVEQIRRSKRRGIVACGLSHFVPAVVAGKPGHDAGEPLDFSEVVPLVAEIDKAAEGEHGVIGRLAIIQTAAVDENHGGTFVRRRHDARPYLDASRDNAIQERSIWRAEFRRLQDRWTASAGKLWEAQSKRIPLV